MCSELRTSAGGCGVFLRDLTNRELLKIKLLFFIILSGMVVVWPSFSLQAEALGLTKRDIGIMGAVQAVTFIIVPPLAGMAGDKIGNFQILLFSMALLTALSASLFTVVPSAVNHQITSNNSYPANGTLLTTFNNHTEFSGDTLELPEDRNDTSRFISSGKFAPNYAVTFWTYFAVKALFGFSAGAAFTMFDGAVMSHMQERGVDYGKQRAWGALANALAPLLGGLMVDLLTDGNHNIVFYCSTGLMVFASLLCLRLDLRYKAPASQLTRDIFRQCVQPEMLLLLIALFFNGIFFGFIETYMYLYLGKLGATNVLLGLTISVNVPIEFLLQVTITSIIEKIGHAAAIFIGTIGCAVRLLGFSLLSNPWYVLILEVIEGVSNGFLLSAAIMYCGTLVSPSSIVSFRGIIGTTYWGFGPLIGSLAGGAISTKLGDRLTFRVMSAIALFVAIVYIVIYYAIIKFRKSKNTRNGILTQIPTKDECVIDKDMDMSH